MDNNTGANLDINIKLQDFEETNPLWTLLYLLSQHGREFDPEEIFIPKHENYVKIMNNCDEEYLPNKYTTFQGKQMKIYINRHESQKVDG